MVLVTYDSYVLYECVISLSYYNRAKIAVSVMTPITAADDVLRAVSAAAQQSA